MIDYDGFKKALVRISVLSQEKLKGEQGADEFREKLEADTKKREALIQKQKAAHEQQASAKKGEQEKLESLRNQFQEDQAYRNQSLSKKAKDAKGGAAADNGRTSPRGGTLTQKQRDQLKQYQLDQAKLVQEEQFFNKWLKQRENLGINEQTEETSIAKLNARRKDMT